MSDQHSNDPVDDSTYYLVRMNDSCRYPLLVGATSVGRSPENGIPIPTGGVSRRHCMLWVHASGGCEIQDAASRNGTFIKRKNFDIEWKRIDREWLRPGDLINICGECFVLGCDREDLRNDGGETEPPLFTSSQYEIITELGRGTTGVVYKVQNHLFNRFNAVKTLRPAEATELPMQIARFHREARLLAYLTSPPHPNIPTLHEVGEWRGHHYMTREFVDGQDLEQQVKSGLVTIRGGVNILAQIAATIHEIHERGFVHRNLRPSNILVGPDNTAKLIGFGQAGFTTGSPFLPAGAKGASTDMDIDGLCNLVSWLGAKVQVPISIRFERLNCKCAALGTLRPFASAAELASELLDCIT